MQGECNATECRVILHHRKPLKDDKLAKPNYQYEKRQKDLAKKKKNEEKRQRKLDKKNAVVKEDSGQAPGTPAEQNTE